MRVEAFVRKTIKLTEARHELCTWGEPTRPGVGGLSRKRYTQYVGTFSITGREGLQEHDDTGRGPTTEGQL
jgi:hypothetical protein